MPRVAVAADRSRSSPTVPHCCWRTRRCGRTPWFPAMAAVSASAPAPPRWRAARWSARTPSQAPVAVDIGGDAGLFAYGALSAWGATAGGDITTYSGGDFDLRGFAGRRRRRRAAPGPGPQHPGSGRRGARFAVDRNRGQRCTGRGAQHRARERLQRHAARGTSPSDAGDIGFDAGSPSPPWPESLAFRADAQGGIYGDDLKSSRPAAPVDGFQRRCFGRQYRLRRHRLLGRHARTATAVPS